MRVKEIMQRDVVTVSGGQTCAQAAQILRDRGISSLIVNGSAAPLGIITERDYVNLVADGQDPSSVTVAERMTTNLVTVESSAEVADAADIMADHHIRHLPVVDEGKLVGVISIRDPVLRHPAMHRYEQERRRSIQSQAADRITQFAGSMPFVYVHA